MWIGFNCFKRNLLCWLAAFMRIHTPFSCGWIDNQKYKSNLTFFLIAWKVTAEQKGTSNIFRENWVDVFFRFWNIWKTFMFLAKMSRAIMERNWKFCRFFLSQTLLYALFGSNHLTLIDLSCILSTETLTIAFVWKICIPCSGVRRWCSTLSQSCSGKDGILTALNVSILNKMWRSWQ